MYYSMWSDVCTYYVAPRALVVPIPTVYSYFIWLSMESTVNERLFGRQNADRKFNLMSLNTVL